MLSRLLLLATALLASLAAAQAAPMAASPQDYVNRFASEPWRFSGESQALATLGQTMTWKGETPARLLIGLNPQGQNGAISGELIALDAASRPLAAAPISGRFTTPPERGTAATPCVLSAATPRPITLTGLCAPAQLTGAFEPDDPSIQRVPIAPGLLEGPMAGPGGTYWLTAWRP